MKSKLFIIAFAVCVSNFSYAYGMAEGGGAEEPITLRKDSVGRIIDSQLVPL